MKLTTAFTVLLTGFCTMLPTLSTQAAEECMLGEVRTFAGSFAPTNWALADGQLIPIESNFTLYAVLGITYGGDGVTTFALPDLRGRTIIHRGVGPGLSSRFQGDKGGTESVAITGSGPSSVQNCQGGPCTLVNDTVPNMQPFTVLNHIICINGYFPSRS